MQKTIDQHLSIRGGHLFIEDCDTTELVKEFGSPIFVMSEARIRDNVRRFQKSFQQYWPDGEVNVLPANKANWNTAVRSILTQEGAGADIYSAGELEAALRCNVKPEMISVNGGGKPDEMLRRCVEAGVHITIEDLDEPARVNKIAAEMGKKAYIRLRVKPDLSNLWRKSEFSLESSSIDIAVQLYKAGIPEEYLVNLGKEVLQMEHVELVGLHFHAGRNHASLWYWRGQMKKYAKLILKLHKAWGGWMPQELDMGGGFASHRDPHSKLGLRFDTIFTYLTYPFELLSYALTNMGRYKLMSFMINDVLTHKPGKFRAPKIEDYARVAVTTLRDALVKGGMDLTGVKLQLEPGRSMYGDTGIHLASVKKFKQQTKPVKMNWVLTDTTYFFLAGGIYEWNFHEYLFANKADAPLNNVADVVGHSCYADRILPFVKVPDVEEGDIIAFLDMGAYQEVSASNFNALPRPAVVLVNGNQAEVIKEAETIDDVFRRDRIPERLRTVPAEELEVLKV